MTKRTLCTMAIITVAALALTGCRGQVAVTPTLVEQLQENDLQVFWNYQIPLQAGETVERYDVAPGRIYARTNVNRLYAIDSYSGTTMWFADLGGAGLKTSPVAQFRGVVFVSVLDRLYGFDADEGGQIFSRRLARAPSTKLVTNGDFVYFGTNEGWFHAVHIRELAKNWDRNAHTAIVAAPVFDDAHVYFANISGEVFVSAATMRRDFMPFVAGAGVTADLKRTPNRGLILVPSRDYTLYAVNPVNGMPEWRCTQGSPMVSPAYPVGNRIYVIPENRVLLSLDEQNGEVPLWRLADIRSFIAASPRTVFVLDAQGRLVGVSPQDGAVRFRLQIANNRPLLNEVDGQLYLANRNGGITCLRERRVDYPLPADVRVRPPVTVD